MTQANPDAPSTEAGGTPTSGLESELPPVDPVYPEGCSSCGAQIRVLARHVYAFGLLRVLTVRHRRFVRDARPLALHLESTVFPALRRDRISWIELRPCEGDGDRLLCGTAQGREYRFPGTRAVAEYLDALDVRCLRLDTQLESGQVVEALLSLLHAGPNLADAPVEPSPYAGWSARRVAGVMAGPHGFHKFCSVMQFDTESRCYEVKYSYCELFFSRVVRTYITHRSRFRDHRALFAAAPRAALLILVVFAAPIVLLLWNATAALVAAACLALLAALLTGIGLHMVGSLQYTREHHDMLIREHYGQVAILSRFPETNPNPVLKLDREGRVVYANPASKHLVRRLGYDHDNVEAVLPPDFAALVSECIGDNAPRSTELTLHGRNLHFTLTSLPDEGTVIAAGTDVTYLRKMEQELRVLNQGLERLVEERTHELHETQDITILSLAGLAETRDPETGQHLQRTRQYVRILAEALRNQEGFADHLDDATIDHLYKSTPLHDIGKVGVPDAILRKPGPLTTEEREEMKRHTLYGGETLRRAEERLGFNSFLGIARDIAYSHHERWDGTGYPEGLKGGAIPWAARLMALADVYDALTSRRVYKEAFSHEDTRERIVRERGLHFDPAVVDAFLTHEREFAEVARQLADEAPVG